MKAGGNEAKSQSLLASPHSNCSIFEGVNEACVNSTLLCLNWHMRGIFGLAANSLNPVQSGEWATVNQR